MEARDEEIIATLLQIARFCGIAPPEKPSRLGFLYHLLVLCVCVGVSVFSMVQTATHRYSSLSTMKIVIDIIPSISVLIQGVSIQASSLLCPSAWHDLLRDLHIGSKTGKNGRSGRIHLELVILHVVFLTRVVWNTAAWSEFIGYDLERYYIFRLIHEYGVWITISLMVHVNLIIKRRFRNISEALKLSPTLFIKTFEAQSHVSCSYIRHLEVNYRKLTQLVDHFNSVFGYNVMFIMANSVSVVLSCFYYSMTHHDFSVPGNLVLVGWCITAIFIAMVTVRVHQPTLNPHGVFLSGGSHRHRDVVQWCLEESRLGSEGVPRGSGAAAAVFVGEGRGLQASDAREDEKGAVYGRELFRGRQRNTIWDLERHHDVFYYSGAAESGELIRETGHMGLSM